MTSDDRLRGGQSRTGEGAPRGAISGRSTDESARGTDAGRMANDVKVTSAGGLSMSHNRRSAPVATDRHDEEAGEEDDVRLAASALVDVCRNASSPALQAQSCLGGDGRHARGRASEHEIPSSSESMSAVEEIEWQMADSIGDEDEGGNAMPGLNVVGTTVVAPTDASPAGISAAGMRVLPVDAEIEGAGRQRTPAAQSIGFLLRAWRGLRRGDIHFPGWGSNGGGNGNGKWLWRILVLLRSGIVLFIAWRICRKVVRMHRDLKRADKLLRTQRQDLRRLQAEVLVSRALVQKLERQVLPLAAVEAAGFVNSAVIRALSRAQLGGGGGRSWHETGGAPVLPVVSVVERVVESLASAVDRLNAGSGVGHVRKVQPFSVHGSCGGRHVLLTGGWSEPGWPAPNFRYCELSAVTWGA